MITINLDAYLSCSMYPWHPWNSGLLNRKDYLFSRVGMLRYGNCFIHVPLEIILPQCQKTYLGRARSAKIQISLRISAGWSESSLGAFWIAKVSLCGQRRLWSDCVDAQADLSLRWAHFVEGTFSHVADQLITVIFVYKKMNWRSKRAATIRIRLYIPRYILTHWATNSLLIIIL